MTCIAFTPDTQRVASCSRDGTIRMWNMEDGSLFGVVGVADQRIWSIAFSPSGQDIASVSDDVVVQFWNVVLFANADQSEDVNSVGRVRLFALSGDGKQVAALTWGDKLRLRNTLNGSQICEFNAPGTHVGAIMVRNADKSAEVGERCKRAERIVWNLSISRDGVKTVSFAGDGYIRIWDTVKKRLVGCIMNADLLSGIAFSGDAGLIICTDCKGVTRIWKTDSRKMVFQSQTMACQKTRLC